MSELNNCLIIFDCEKKGSEKQCIYLAEALNLSYTLLPVANYIWLKLLPRFFWHYFSFSNLLKQTVNQYFTFVISSGSRASAIAPCIKRRHKNIKLINILNPRLPLSWYDCVIAPKHDQLTGNNVINTNMALHNFNQTKLIEIRNSANNFFTCLKKPVLTLLIGSNSKSCYSKEIHYLKLIKHIKNICDKDKVSLLISFSRRTSLKIQKLFISELQHLATQIYTGEKVNPYNQYLAFADYIIITADSISMISEACASNKHVLIAEHQVMSNKFQRFLYNLYTTHAVQKFNGQLSNKSSITLNEMPDIVKTVTKKLAISSVKMLLIVMVISNNVK